VSTPFITVITGTLVFVIGQIILKIIIEPYIEQQKVVAKIVHSLVYYANVYSSEPFSDIPEPQQIRLKEASLTYRTLASDLVSVNNFIRGYYVWRYFLFAPSKENINESCKALIALSNSLWGTKEDKRHTYKKELEKRLGISTIKFQ